MDPNYTFSLSPSDQEIYVNLDKNLKFKEIIKSGDFSEKSTSEFVLSSLKKKLIKNTIENFPIELKLFSKQIFESKHDDIYDVRFVMPLIWHAVSPDVLVDCRDFIAKRCLALSIIGLSSNDLHTRACCYSILERFHFHLQSSLLFDKLLWINFLDILKNSLPEENYALRPLFATFLVRLIDIILHPENDKMYGLIKEVLAEKPRLRVDTIEIFYDLLHCSDVDLYQNNVRWLITLFRDGIKTPNDVKMAQSLNLGSHLMCLYNSGLTDANDAICSVFIKLINLPNGLSYLVNTCHFLPWLNKVILDELSSGNCFTAIYSVVFALVDALPSLESASNIIEFVFVLMTTGDLIIKFKQISTLSTYLNHIIEVSKYLLDTNHLSEQLTHETLKLIESKHSYLFINKDK